MFEEERVAPQEAVVSAAPQQAALDSQDVAASDVELLVAKPSEELDLLVVRYGYQPVDLQYELRVERSDLELVRTETGAEAYRYVLRGIPKDRALFVTIAAARGGELSPESEVIEIR